MWASAKATLARLMERHPLGYALAVQVMNRSDLLLPHEPDYLAFPVLSRLFPGTFLDLGANQGHSARAFGKLVKDRPVVSVEANPYHRPALERVRHRLPGYTYHLRAVDRVSGLRVEFFTPVYKGIVCHSAASTSLAEAEASIRSVWPRLLPAFRFERSAVETVAVDDLGLTVGLVKMDIQGKEVDALQGCRETIRRCRPAFLIEIVTERERIQDFMRAAGYTAFNFDPARGCFGPAADRPAGRNLFFLPVEKGQALRTAAA